MTLQTETFKKYQRGDRPSANDLNSRGDVLSKIARSLNQDGIVDSTGFLGRKKTTKFVIKLFEVQSVATGDGIYNCYEQQLDATEWADTAGDSKIDNYNENSIEVLNLAEFDPEAAYLAHLGAGDLIVAWKKTDDEANTRWIGLPLRQANGDRTRIAWCAENAPADNTISCLLDGGNAITVTCSIAQGGTALNAAVPRLKSGDYIFITRIGGAWYCTTIFMPSENCLCSS